MASTNKENGPSGRRKSISLFSKSYLSGLADTNVDNVNLSAEDADKKEKKMAKRTSVFGLTTSATMDVLQDGTLSHTRSEKSNSPRLRPRTLQKNRPASLFGSLGRKSINLAEGGEPDNLSSTTPESPKEDGGRLKSSPSNGDKAFIHHGEVQTTSGIFRKKKEYLVLTETHLMRFKSQSRASDAYPSIPTVHGRSTSIRHPSTASVGSLHEVQSNNSHTSADGDHRIPLGQVVATYKLDDGRPFFTTEVVYLDEEYHGAGSIQLMLHDLKESDTWHASIRSAARKARLPVTEPHSERVLRYLVTILESADDYDPDHFQVFRVVRRAAPLKGGRSSSDDIQKLGSAVIYMVVGIYSMHLIPVPDFSEASGRLINSKARRSAFGLVSLVAMSFNNADDRFELAFRTPLQPVKMLELASSEAHDIATAIFRACQYLKPQWLDFNFTFAGPRGLLDAADAPVRSEFEEYGGFERTLVAYCTAYNCNPANIQYAVDWAVEDAPEFKLFCPANTAKYSIYELLAIMRALRYNESFHSISLRDIDLHCMHGLHDSYGTDHVAWTSRSGLSIRKYFNIKPHERSLLYQEVQGLGLKSKKLRRMDFGNALPRRRPRDTFDEEGGASEKDPGCEIVAALLPLCRGQLTNIDWIILSGIELGETDLDDLIPALNEPLSRIRAIECSHSGLNDRGIMQLLSHLERQNSTLECIDISDNPGRIHLERFQVSMSRFALIRKLDLSRITRTSGDQPLIAPEVMLSWRLEELILNGIPVNDKTLDSISAYLASDMSNSLRILQMDQCSLTGTHVGVLMRSMTRVAGEARNLQLHVSANRLEKGIGEIVTAIEENHTPAHLVVRMIEFTKEDHFRQLLQALRTNTTVRSLDVSKASLPYDASQETCDALQQLFADNTTLEDLDISGEQAHLEVTRFGIGLNQALTGLKKNKTLKVLRIEYQNLGLEGANTLSDVLEENTGLTHILCEHNDINLQGFTILVNSLAKNFTVLELPFMFDDQGESIKRMSENMRDSKRTASTERSDKPRRTSVRRTLTSFGVSKPQKQEMTPQDVDAVVKVLGERWDREFQRLAIFLDRNKSIAAGLQDPDAEGVLSREVMRPTTAMSDRGILEQVLSNTTPKLEISDPTDSHGKKLVGLNILGGVDVGRSAEVNDLVVQERGTAGDDTRHLQQKSGPDRGNPLPLQTLGQEKVFDVDFELFQMDS